MEIEVNTDSLSRKSAEIRVLKAELERVMEEIEGVVLSANGSWQGDSEKAFSEKILYVKKQFSHIGTFFGEYADLLQNFAQIYEQQETDLSAKINLV